MTQIIFAVLIVAASQTWAVPAAVSSWERYSVLSLAGPAEPPENAFPEIRRLIFTRHKVLPGETSLAVLAKRFGTTPMGLEATNGSDLFLLHPGQTIVVLNKDGLLYQVRKKQESLDAIAARFYRDHGQAQEFKSSVIIANGLPGIAMMGRYNLAQGTQILLPRIKVTFDTYRYPFKGRSWGRISSGFGMRYHPILHSYRFHDGFDIPKPWGTPVYPARSGQVVYAGWMGGYGNLIIVRHRDGATTRYGHLSKIYVAIGERVARGNTLIGRVGSTGLSTGPHLHFEVRDKYGRALNPGHEIGRP